MGGNLKLLVGVLVGAVVTLLLFGVFSGGGMSPMMGGPMMGGGMMAGGMIFTLVLWVVVLILIVTLIVWIVGQYQRR